jgi:hypothetical protein
MWRINLSWLQYPPGFTSNIAVGEGRNSWITGLTENERKKEKVGRNMRGEKDAKEETMKEEIELRWKDRRRQERGATKGKEGMREEGI